MKKIKLTKKEIDLIYKYKPTFMWGGLSQVYESDKNMYVWYDNGSKNEYTPNDETIEQLIESTTHINDIKYMKKTLKEYQFKAEMNNIINEETK